MMKNIRAGLFAGLIAGLILAILSFLDYGPGGLLHRPASWLHLDNPDTGKYIGFTLFILLGGVFGILFGLVQGKKEATIGRSLLLGTATGGVFWIVVRFFFGKVIYGAGLDFGGFLYSFIPLLLYGVLLGALYFQRSARTACSAPVVSCKTKYQQ